MLVLLLAAAALSCLLGPVACASRQQEGFYYTVQRGDNLYRIGQRFGVPTKVLIETNRIKDVRKLKVGRRLWIPKHRAGAGKGRAPSASGGAQRATGLKFAWPLRGTRTSSFGTRGGRKHEGLDLAAPRGTTIRAAEAGKVIHSGWLGDYGKAVIIKHVGYYSTVYAHANKILVGKGKFVERGQKIAEVGSTGRATGPHLHFEIRYRETPQNPLRYLP